MASVFVVITKDGVPVTGLAGANIPEVNVLDDTGASFTTGFVDMAELSLGAYHFGFAAVDGREYVAIIDADPALAGNVNVINRYRQGAVSGTGDARINVDIPGILTAIAALNDIPAGTAMTLTAGAIDTIWDELQAGHVTAGSFGEFLNALVTSRSSHSAADVDTTLTGAHGAGSWASATSVGLTAAAIDAIWDELLAGHAIVGSAGEALAAAGAGGDPAAIADAVWDELQSGHLTAGTFGAFLNAAITTLQTELSAAARDVANQASHTTTQADIAALENLSIANVQTALTNQGYTSGRAPNLDNLDDTITSRQSEADANTRAIADQAGHTATLAAIAALENPTVAAIVAAILAGIIDGTVDLGEVLLRVNAFVRGRVVRDDINATTIDVEYYEEDDTTIAFENRKTTALRTPQP